MNPIAIANQLSAMPEGMPIENRRQRLTIVLGMALALATALPSSPLANGELRSYFRENSCGDKLFQINEAVPFDVDRAQEYGFRIWERRYNLAFNPKASDMTKLAPYSQALLELMPEVESMLVTDSEVNNAVQLLCADQAV